MKRLIISVTLLLISLLLCIFSYSGLKKMSLELDSALSQCDEALQGENEEQSEERIEKINLLWEKRKAYYKILTDGSFCETIDNCIDSVTFCISEKEYTDARSSISDCRNTLRQILENEKLSFEIVM